MACKYHRSSVGDVGLGISLVGTGSLNMGISIIVLNRCCILFIRIVWRLGFGELRSLKEGWFTDYTSRLNDVQCGVLATGSWSALYSTLP